MPDASGVPSQTAICRSATQRPCRVTVFRMAFLECRRVVNDHCDRSSAVVRYGVHGDLMMQRHRFVGCLGLLARLHNWTLTLVHDQDVDHLVGELILWDQTLASHGPSAPRDPACIVRRRSHPLRCLNGPADEMRRLRRLRSFLRNLVYRLCCTSWMFPTVATS